MSEWIEHAGGPCPVAPETLVKVWLEGEDPSHAEFWEPVPASTFVWERRPRRQSKDIIAYQVTLPSPPSGED